MSASNQEFQPGDTVVYALHGKGAILSVETLNINGTPEEFLKIKMESKSKKTEVLVPRARAREMGLRYPLESGDLPKFFAQMAEPHEINPMAFDWEVEEKRIYALLAKGKWGLAKAVNRLHQTLRVLTVTSQPVENTYKALRSQVQVEITQALRKHHKQVRNMINDVLGGDYSKPYRKPQIPNLESRAKVDVN